MSVAEIETGRSTELKLRLPQPRLLTETRPLTESLLGETRPLTELPLTETRPLTETPPLPVLPEDSDRFEYINHQWIKVPPMGVLENRVMTKITARMEVFAEQSKLGKFTTETLFHLKAIGQRYKPDGAFVSAKRWPHSHVPMATAWEVVPDIAVEVVSPTNMAIELMCRVLDYLRAGVTQVWVVYPSLRTLFVYDSSKSARGLSLGDSLTAEPILSGFALPVATVFEDVGPDALASVSGPAAPAAPAADSPTPSTQPS